MHRTVRRTARPASLPGWLATTLVMASAPALLSGCSGDRVLATIGMQTSEIAQAGAQAGAAPPGPSQADGPSNAPVVTVNQRAYLDGLAAAGVKPSSDLLALSIGSYVCQARAAKQTDQEVWDLVLPLVRSDVRSGRVSAMAPTPGSVNSATADYIRIASERLC